MRVTIAIPTYRRPETLRALLDSLEKLAFEKVPEPRITVLVVDNDPNGFAARVLRSFHSCRYEVRSRMEREPGISHARNLCIREAGRPDYVAFIDDDEVASTRWLDELLNAQLAFRAPIVAGPIVPRYAVHPPAWCVQGAFHQRRRYQTGACVRSTSAGNVLLARPVLDAVGDPWFDACFARSGGEDTHFFRRCAGVGFPITWADDAIVYEHIPADRLTADYLIRRARDGGSHWSRVDLALSLPAWRLAFRFATGVTRIAQGSALSACSPLLSSTQRLRAKMRIAEGIGNLSAFFGRDFATYRPQ